MYRLWLLCCLCLLIPAPGAYAEQQTGQAVVNIGVLAYEGKQQSLQRWQPTAEYLSRLIPAYTFRLQPLTHQEMVHAINKGVLDFILTNPGHYVQLEAQAGATRIAMFKTVFQGQALTRFGAVIFTRADSDINDFSDLKQRSFAAVNTDAFGGFLLAQRELLNHGVEQSDLHLKWLGFPQGDIVRQVLTGKVDAGTVRSGVLEQLVISGVVDLQSLRILGQQRNSDFPLLHSTALYPEWPFARLPQTDTVLSEQVAIALLQMSAQEPAAQHSGGAGWTIPMDYSAVHEVMRALNVAPYHQKSVQPSFWTSYWHWIMAGILLLLLSLLAIVLISRTNRQLKQSRSKLLQEINERQNIEKLLANQREELDRMIAGRTEALQRSNEELQNEIALMSRFEQKIQDQELARIRERDDGEFAGGADNIPVVDEALQQRFAGVTPRELEILKLVAHGESNKSIANLLHISPKTVELHRANLIAKTEANSSTDLVRLAVLAGLIR
jgi:ABC-type phosphate/phosphonate transport system substrate-binding protein/DNA-binding CsgD family transcriptional regulator